MRAYPLRGHVGGGWVLEISIPDPNPDPPDSRVFWPPGSGSFFFFYPIFFFINKKKYRKILITVEQRKIIYANCKARLV
jgi:hypothetical protein